MPPRPRRDLTSRTLVATSLVALALLLATAGYAEARGAPRWLTRLFRAVSGRAEVPAALAAPGDTVVLFGPKTLALGSGTSATFVEKFTVSGLPTTTTVPAASGYLLRTTNGPNGLGAVTGGTITLNGAVVVTASQLAALSAGASLTIPVQVAPSDTLVAALSGPAGSAVSVSVLAAPDPTFLVFGPKQYERVNGQPITVVERFSVPQGGVAPSYLCVRNGELDGTRRNSSATVRLNGVDVVTQSELNQQVAGFKKKVTFLRAGQENVLEVQLQGAPGSRLTLCAAASDAAPPTIAVTAPATGLITNKTEVDAVGIVTDQTAVTITVNGQAATVAAGTADKTSFTARIPLAVEGANTITIRAVDAAGNATDSVRTVIRDTEAPVVTLDALPDSALYRADSVLTITGTITDRSAVTANVNGVALVVDSATHAFSQQVTLAQGTNFIAITATDAAGNATSVVRQVTLDNVPPTLTLTAPAQGAIGKVATATVVGSAVAQSAVTVTVNGVTVAVGANGAFTKAVALSEGSNTITVVASNAAGVTATATRTVVLDTQAPAIAWSAPVDSAITKQAVVDVSGSITDRTAVTLTLNGAAVGLTTIDPLTKSFLALEPVVDDGLATLTLVASDAAGNVTTAKRVITKDATAPVITVIEPDVNVVTNAASAHVVGSVADLTKSTLTVNGTTFTIAADGGFVGDVPLAAGSNTLTFVATDAAGNQSTVARTLVRDADPPVVTVSSPSDNVLVKTSTVTVSGTIADASAVTATLNGVALVLAADKSYQTTIALSEGANVLTLVATDAAGNATTTTRSITLDTTAPVLAVTAPVDGFTTQEENVAVAGTATDQSAVTVTVNGSPATLASGAFSATVALTVGSNAIQVVATDSAGNVSNATVTVIRRAIVTNPTGEVIGIDPQLTAAPLPTSVPSTLANSTSFLYTGANAPQIGVAPNTIDRVRASVIRGRVVRRDGTPIQAVRVAVADQPSFGYTSTRASGQFDFAVNGGTTVVLRFTAPGYLDLERTVSVEWQRYASAIEVAMVPLDTQATVIRFASPVEVARGSVSNDQRGTRQATLMLASGTTATAVLPNGATQVLSSATVRATEYTVGTNGPAAMVADLPPSSGYTYLAEFTVDEARALGATDIRFSKDVAAYVDNFLNFPVGESVPAGYYDAKQHAWIASVNGRVVKLVSTPTGPGLVIDASGQPATSAALAALGVSTAELQQLASIYGVGKTLWRTPLSHFTAWDFNWPYLPPTVAMIPERDPDAPDNRPPDDMDCKKGSLVLCQSGALGERIALPGLSFGLHYRTDRESGFRANNRFTIPLTGKSVPDSVLRVDVTVQVAGRTVKRSFAPSPSATFVFEWDGIDVYGRRPFGKQTIRALVQNVYRATYGTPSTNPQAFAALTSASAGSVTQGRPQLEIALGASYEGTVGSYDLRGLGLGGWSLEPHHIYDPTAHTLLLGDGSVRGTTALGTARIIAGTGVLGSTGDGGPADRATFFSVYGWAVAPDGSIYLSDGGAKIRKITPDGIINTWNLSQGADMVVDKRGTVYIQAYESIWRINADGSGTRVAGGGGNAYPVEGTHIFDLRIFQNFAHLAVGPNNDLFFSYQNNIWRIGRDDRLHHVAGNGTCDGFQAPLDGVATQVPVCAGALDVGPDGSVVFAEEGRQVLRRVAPDGMLRTIAGRGFCWCSPTDGDGGPARSAAILRPYSVSIAPDGTIYFTTGTWVRRITPDGIISTVAGSDIVYSLGAGLSPRQMAFQGQAATVKVAPDGSLLVVDGLPRIIRVTPQLPGLSPVQMVVPSDDGSELYVIDAAGRHSETRLALTNTRLRSFQYDPSGRLGRIDDAREGSTTIVYNDAARQATLTTPAGRRATLSLNIDGRLTAVATDIGDTTAVTYAANGLPATLSSTSLGTHAFGYDSVGYLVSDSGPNVNTTLVRRDTTRGSVVAVRNHLGGTTQYTTSRSADGSLVQSTLLGNGATISASTSPSDLATIVTQDGTRYSVREGSDPRFGMQVTSPTSTTVTVPSGLNLTMTAGRAFLPDNGSAILGTLIDSVRVDGRLYRFIRNSQTRQVTEISPEGRSVVTSLDSLGRITTVALPWDTVGVSYSPTGEVSEITDGTTTQRYEYDSRGRASALVAADGKRTTLSYDLNDRLKEVVLSGRIRQTMNYDPLAKTLDFDINGAARYSLTFDREGRLAGLLAPGALQPSLIQRDARGDLQVLTRSDGSTVQVLRDSIARIRGVNFSGRMHTYAYNARGQLMTERWAPTDSVTYAYDGLLPKRLTFSGTVAATIDYTYNTSFQPITLAINGSPLSMTFDRDGLLTGAGSLTLHRGATGAPAKSILGAVTDTTTYASDRNIKSHTVKANSVVLFAATYQRDGASRIMTDTTRQNGRMWVSSYSYDSAGHLATVVKDANPTVAYDYDAFGRRKTKTTANGATTYFYGAEDQVSAFGGITYAYSADGERTLRVTGSDTTRYVFDALSRLVSVKHSNGRTTAYTYDARSRRIARAVDGITVARYLYAGQLSPVAELNAAGQIVTRFVYAQHDNVPDYMVKNGRSYRLVTDHLGSVRLVVDASDGSIVQELDYDELGRVILNTQPGFQPFGFAGGLYDEDTKLTHFGTRDYDAEVGFWLSRDRAGVRLFSTESYGYTLGDPINARDPDGRSPMKDCLKKLLQPYFPDLNLDDVDLEYGSDLLLSNRLNRDMQISAMTFGTTIYFNYNRGGEINADPRQRIWLLAHELTHTQQYRQAGHGYFLPAYLYESGFQAGQRLTGKPVDPYRDNRFEKDANRSANEIIKDIDERYGPKMPCKNCKIP